MKNRFSDNIVQEMLIWINGKLMLNVNFIADPRLESCMLSGTGSANAVLYV